MARAVFDTNVFVAAGFNPRSASATLLARVKAGEIAMVWSDETRDETRSVLTRIPRLRWDDAAPLFRPEHRYGFDLDLAAVGFVEDPQDRKFAALAGASGAVLVSADDHLLAHRGRLDVATPGEFLRDSEGGDGKRE